MYHLNKYVLYVTLRGHCLSDLAAISLLLWCIVAGESRYSPSDTLLEMYFNQYVGYWISPRITAHTGGSLDVICELWTVYWCSNFLLWSKFMFLRAIWEQVLVNFCHDSLSCTIWSENNPQIIRFTSQHFWIITSSCKASSVTRP